MGLHRDYRLDPRNPLERGNDDPGEDEGNRQLHADAKADEYRLVLHGFDMLDDKGRPIGVWYSIMTARTLVRMQEDGTVRIDTPDLETYEKDPDR